jgi:K+-sensing histidine kinase KdpD
VSFHDDEGYRCAVESLAAQLVGVASQFCENHGMEFRTQRLHQMPQSPSEFAAGMLNFGADVWPASVAESKDKIEPLQSRISRVWRISRSKWLSPEGVFAGAMLIIGTLMGHMLHYVVIERLAPIPLTTSIFAIAVVCGTKRTLIASVIGAVLTNFFMVAPMFTFSFPTSEQAMRWMVWIVIALVVPRLVDMRNTVAALRRIKLLASA